MNDYTKLFDAILDKVNVMARDKFYALLVAVIVCVYLIFGK
ncbi:hypothetical protein [Moraxella sp. Pampa]|nr:hypothetical protein [Moraxella sp. Pampa]